jgi:hypothetical protein
VRALQEPGSATATWEVASTEPGLDLEPDAPAGWSLASGAPAGSVAWGRIAHPFVFRTAGPALGPSPVDIAGFTLAPLATGTELTLTVVPQRPGLTVAFILPPGVTPARTSLPGVQRMGRWTATYVAVPLEGVAWRASFNGLTPEQLHDVHITIVDAGFPGGDGWQRLPRWLPQERTVWTGIAAWAVPATAIGRLEPIRPLR